MAPKQRLNAMKDEVIGTVSASMGRRVLGIASLALLGVLLIYVCFTQPPAALGQFFLLLTGAGALWIAEKMRRATSAVIELTATELRNSSGEVICLLDDVESIDRGFFAFKPSNGFLLKTKSSGARAWHPGLWWRAGRRIGIGGMTPGHQTKFVSEIIAATIAQRDL
jgi:hypothetical protein